MMNKLEIIIFCGVIILIILHLNEECSTIPRNGIYIVDKYSHNEYHKNICQCSTTDEFANYDGYVIYEGLASSDMYFLNCNENILATMTVGNYFGIRIGDNNIFVRYLFKDRNHKVIGYSDKYKSSDVIRYSDKYKSSDVIEIKDIYGDQIAILKKPHSGIGWIIIVANQNYTLSNPSILLDLVGQKAFDNDFDSCFLTKFVIWPCFLFVLLCVCGMTVCIKYYWKYIFFVDLIVYMKILSIFFVNLLT